MIKYFIYQGKLIMNIKALLIVLLLGSASLARGDTVLMADPCKCYCSDKCGPRLANKSGDAPFFDEKLKKCFCQKRDQLNYRPNHCSSKPQEKFTSCCDEKAYMKVR